MPQVYVKMSPQDFVHLVGHPSTRSSCGGMINVTAAVASCAADLASELHKETRGLLFNPYIVRITESLEPSDLQDLVLGRDGILANVPSDDHLCALRVRDLLKVILLIVGTRFLRRICTLFPPDYCGMMNAMLLGEQAPLYYSTGQNGSTEEGIVVTSASEPMPNKQGLFSAMAEDERCA